jgi:uncharacterized membrane protein YuzA (DUF378 family)
MQILNIIYFVSIILVVVGGLNWLSVGMKGDEGNFVAKFVTRQFSNSPNMLKNVLTLVGIAAIVVAVGNFMLYQKYGLSEPFEQK